MNTMTEAMETGSEWLGRNASPVWFLPTSATLLAITGVSKTWSALSHTKLLAVADPITGIKGPFGSVPSIDTNSQESVGCLEVEENECND